MMRGGFHTGPVGASPKMISAGRDIRPVARVKPGVFRGPSIPGFTRATLFTPQQEPAIRRAEQYCTEHIGGEHKHQQQPHIPLELQAGE